MFPVVPSFPHPAGLFGSASGHAGILCGVLEFCQGDVFYRGGAITNLNPCRLGLFPLAWGIQQLFVLPLHYLNAAAFSGNYGVQLPRG